ncbi:NERD nuclease [Bacillus methanolicus]|uniref:nuclease-related domain-containing protein n=1 Tax=Bacillus methanolicus TaxID=1471 RepID=UPI00238016E0|nr:nuclease-related domain-containing protein [Bacillus methanolicus]MDE3838975.1 NERD nuclease [Bacillus methanolicus]
MIVKPRTIPLRIRKCEAILRRLPKNHPKQDAIKDDLAKRRAGFYGEQALDYHIGFLDEKMYYIFHDLRLPFGQQYFQIDTLILSTHFALILEVKNMAGTLFFDPSFHQLIRTYNDKEEVFLDPIIQARRLQIQFRKWLSVQQFPDMPVEFLVIIPNTSTFLKTPPENQNINQKVINVHRLLEKIENIQDKYKVEKICPKTMKKLNKCLLKNHTPPNYDLFQTFEISRSELLTGVSCPNCSSIPMARIKGRWQCPVCHCESKDAHLEAIEDYFLLFQPSITNPELRNFLHLSSSFTATRLLKAMNLPYSGSKKGRVYYPHIN